MSTPPRPGHHLSGHQTFQDSLRTDVEPLLDVLGRNSSTLVEMEQQAYLAERAHHLLSESLSTDEVR